VQRHALDEVASQNWRPAGSIPALAPPSHHMSPKNKKPEPFSMERGERIQKLRSRAYSFRYIASVEGISASRAFNILHEYHHRKKLIEAKHWTYGLSTRAQGIIYANDIMCLSELKAFVAKHGANMPDNVNGVGDKIYAELREFAEPKAKPQE
jgi:hypothetical protein